MNVTMTDTKLNEITLTVRLVRSFEHRNIKHIVYKDVDPSQSVNEFKTMVDNDIKVRPGLPLPFKKGSFDTMKISHQAFGAKTNDPVINRDRDDELILQDDKTLEECGVGNETELSYFRIEDYRKYQQNPHLVW